MKRHVILFLLSFMLVPTTGAKPSSSMHALLPKFEALIRESMKEKKIPGLAVAVVVDGKIIFMKGFGVRAVGTSDPIDTHTVFQIGSTSKAITSVLVALLKRDKILSLSHPVDIIPNTTLKHLLSHTTGIPSWGFNTLIEKGVPAVKAYQKVQKTVPESPPGEQFSYHNVIYSLVGRVIEEKTGNSFDKTLQVRLFKPLHMKETSSTWEAFASRKNKAAVHSFVGREKSKKGKKGKGESSRMVKVAYRKDYANFPASAGCSSSIHDMALFLAALLGARPDVVSSRDLEAFIKPLIHTPDQWHRSRAHRDRITQTHYGLGWRTLTFGGHHLVFHGGWIRGISSLISFIPEKKIGIVILQNAELGLPFALSMQFYDWALGLPEKQWIK